MDKHNNISELTNEELLSLCSKTVEHHESVKNRIVELTLELESRHNELYDDEFYWVQLMEELKRRNDDLQQKVSTES